MTTLHTATQSLKQPLMGPLPNVGLGDPPSSKPSSPLRTQLCVYARTTQKCQHCIRCATAQSHCNTVQACMNNDSHVSLAYVIIVIIIIVIIIIIIIVIIIIITIIIIVVIVIITM